VRYVQVGSDKVDYPVRSVVKYLPRGVGIENDVYCLLIKMISKPPTLLNDTSVEKDLAEHEIVRPMQIFFAALDAPFPVTSGRRLRNWALLQALAAEGHHVTMVYFGEPGTSEVPRELQETCRNVDLVPQPDRSAGSSSTNWNRFIALSSTLPYGAWRLRSLKFQAKIWEWLAKERFDAVISDDIYVAANIPPLLRIPVILNKHGIGTVVLERFLKNERNPLKRMYGFVELLKTRRWETSVCRHAELIMACSQEDSSEINLLSPGARVTIVPNVIDVDQYQPTPAVNNHTVVFVAYMGWYPNQDAVEYFVSSILPILRNLIPDVKFVAAGRNPPDDFRRRLSRVPGVEFTGTVPDIRPIVANAAVSVVPLRIGTGTRLKILEAAAMEKPVVSTRVGAEGLNFADGTEIVLADNPEVFAREIAALLDSPVRAHAIGVAARRHVQEQYSMPALRIAVRQAVAVITRRISENSQFGLEQ